MSFKARSGELFGIPVIALCETPFNGYRGVGKRFTDVILALRFWCRRAADAGPRGAHADDSAGPIIF